MIGDGERITVLTIAEQELTLVIGVSEIVGVLGRRLLSTLGAAAGASAAQSQL
jgi:hypothetical protein